MSKNTLYIQKEELKQGMVRVEYLSSIPKRKISGEVISEFYDHFKSAGFTEENVTLKNSWQKRRIQIQSACIDLNLVLYLSKPFKWHRRIKVKATILKNKAEELERIINEVI